MKKINIEKLNLLMLFIIILKTMLMYSSYFKINNVLENILEIIVYGYIIFIFLTKMKVAKSRIIIFIAILVITLYTGIKINNLVMFSSFLVMCLVSKMNKNKVIKLIYNTIFVILMVHFFIYFINFVMGNVTVIRDLSGRVRHSLGFSHPNISGIYSLWCLLAFAYLNKLDNKKTFTGFIVIIIIYCFNQSRTMIYCSIILMVLTLLFNMHKGEKTIKFISKYAIVIFTLLILLCVYMYNSNISLAIKINTITSNRIYFSAKAIDIYGYTFLGQKCQNIQVNIDNYWGNIVMDVTYSALLYNYGIVYIFLLYLLSRYITKEYSTYEQIFLIIWAIFAFFEIYSLNFAICFPMLFGADWIGGKNDT